jgi:hypothetical protein
MTQDEDWIQLDQDKASAFINVVRDEREPTLFDPSVCEVHALPLSFYDGYALCRIVNRHMLPYLVLDYLSNGENHYYMDGSESAFHNLNAREALSLDESNVVDYLDFYISYVYERGNSLGFVRDDQDGYSAKLENSDGQIFRIQAPLIYDERRIQARIEIGKNGALHIRDPLRVSFLTDLKPGAEITYLHPREAAIIEETKALLEQTETGQNLLAVGEKAAAEIRVLNSPNYQGFVTNSRVIYMTMPAAEETAKYLQALILAGCLRDAEQIAAGVPYPHPAAGEEEYGRINLEKNLDMALEMCKIIDEMLGKGINEAFTAFRSLGLEEVFKGYKNQLGFQDLMKEYLVSLKRNQIVMVEKE